ncbi:MAG: carboxylating nicotinate-nucleotide diphosphorylase [Ignavibacteria bacterium]|nr:carboxylating nicotinate-nucleotide diphosphorylase [Ignavibacteria bacterium]
MGLTETDLRLDEIDRIIDAALKEDVGESDYSTNLIIPCEKISSAYLKAKDEGIVAGLEVAERTFKKLDENFEWIQNCNDGDTIKNGQIIAEMKGTFRAILTGERTALNFLQRMSGIATQTAQFVEAVKPYKTKILDTRKTVPGLRLLDKYSVKAGGGTNHRIGLFDMIMLKDNHIKIAGGITKAVEQVRKSMPKKLKIEVETSNLNEVEEALNCNVDIIMLDNMDIATTIKAVKIAGGKISLEASGNMTLERVREVAAAGVDYISIGSLTHSVKALDIGQYIK